MAHAGGRLTHSFYFSDYEILMTESEAKKLIEEGKINPENVVEIINVSDLDLESE